MTNLANSNTDAGRHSGELLTAVLDALEKRAQALTDDEASLAAFAEWMGVRNNPGDDTLRRLALKAAAHEGAVRQYQDIAILGFACARKAGIDSAEQERLVARFNDGLQWMLGRRFFVAGQPPGFEADGVALMGTADGICSVSNSFDSHRRWLAGIIEKSLARTSPEAWDQSLIRGAAVILDLGPHHSREVSVAPADLAPDLASAMSSVGLVRVTEEGERAARLMIVNPAYRNVHAERAAVQFVALRWLLRSGATALPKRATLPDVVELLARVPHALKRWPWEETPRTSRVGSLAQHWDVQNEYHVQSLLWALLAPLFDDLEDEEYLQSMGHVHPRTDLAIPSLGLIIEVKFLRGGRQHDLTAIINDVSADTGLYLSMPSRFTDIIAFVWDDSRSNDQHSELVAGLRKLKGVADAVVVSRPGRWQRE